MLDAASIRGTLLRATATDPQTTEFPTRNKENVALRTPKFPHPKPRNVQVQMGGTEKVTNCSPEMEAAEVAVDCGGGRGRSLHCSMHESPSVREQQPTCA